MPALQAVRLRREVSMPLQKYKNPVLRGFNPDPSICRVGGDYYLVTSSFEFYPGVPVYHSRNLVHWELISYCLTRDSQLNLKKSPCSGGIYAPTLRYRDGIFYMVTTNVSHGGNFIVHTEDIRGEWSDPCWVDQKGIDPSLLFEDDGRALFCSTLNSNGRQCIALCEVNPLTGERLTETVPICYGSGAKHPEAPHLYKIEDYYYLMMAEGGTEYGHMETIFRSRSPYGPYEACPHNPILTHRDFSGSPIQAAGHADLVEDACGNWWMVCLGIRPLPTGVLLHNLGRETFLAPVVWDRNGWPVVGSNGRIAQEMEGSLPAPALETDSHFEDRFDTGEMKLEWNFVRNPRRENYSLENGRLKLSAGEEDLNDSFPTFAGVRQKEFNACARTRVSLGITGKAPKAGLSAFYNKDYHYELYVAREGEKHFVVLSKKVHDLECVAKKVEIPKTDAVDLSIQAGAQDYSFTYSLGDGWLEAGTGKAAGLCTEGTMTMTFTGVYLGVFASGTEAYFEYFLVTY